MSSPYTLSSSTTASRCPRCPPFSWRWTTPCWAGTTTRRRTRPAGAPGRPPAAVTPPWRRREDHTMSDLSTSRAAAQALRDDLEGTLRFWRESVKNPGSTYAAIHRTRERLEYILCDLKDLDLSDFGQRSLAQDMINLAWLLGKAEAKAWTVETAGEDLTKTLEDITGRAAYLAKRLGAGLVV